MSWLDKNQITLFSKVFDEIDLLPRNKKQGLKLRSLSFYASETKSIKQIVSNFFRYLDNQTQHAQYMNALRNIGLISDGKLTKYGEKFQEVLTANDYAIKEIVENSRDITSIDDKYIFQLELIILLAVYYHQDQNNAIVTKEVINNINYFKVNILDSINTNRKLQDNIHTFTKLLQDNTTLYVLQGINYQGFEIKKLLNLSIEEISNFITEYYNALSKLDKNMNVEKKEFRYYEQLNYYKTNYQRDIVYRVKYTFILSLLLEGIIFPDMLSKYFYTTEEKDELLKLYGLDRILNYEILSENQFSSVVLIDRPHNMIFFGAPGTGKSYELNIEAKKYFGNNYERVTFHPNYLYSHFVGSFKPFSNYIDTNIGANSEVNKSNYTVTYEYIPGILMKQLVKALQDPNTNYLLLIEEINRANVAAVFGDIFQLLDRNKNGESTYHISTSKELQLFLMKEFQNNMYSNIQQKLGNNFERLYLPSNFYIWATMNSADQNVMPLDTAFKRRWDFKYIGIDEIADNNKEEFAKYKFKISPDEVVVWDEYRREVNRQLVSLKIPEDKLIGPYFIAKNILEENDMDKLTEIIKNKVLMYLYEDVGKSIRSLLFRDGVYSTYSSICKHFDENALHIFKGDMKLSTEPINNNKID